MKTSVENKLVIDTKVSLSSSLESAPPTTPVDVKIDEILRKSFFPSQTIEREKILSRNGQILPLEISPRLDRGFFMTNSDWINYRRNYFQISVTFNVADEGFIFFDNRIQKIDCYKVLLRGQIQDSMANIPLLQHNSKRQKNMAVEPGLRDILPNGNHGNLVDAEAGRLIVFERIQFKNATGNNGRRRKGQQYYNLLVEIHAFCGQKSFIVGEIASARLIVRGRSPAHYSLQNSPNLKTLNCITSPSSLAEPNLYQHIQNNADTKMILHKEKEDSSAPASTSYSAPISVHCHGFPLSDYWLHSRDSTLIENSHMLKNYGGVEIKSMKDFYGHYDSEKNEKLEKTVVNDNETFECRHGVLESIRCASNSPTSDFAGSDSQTKAPENSLNNSAGYYSCPDFKEAKGYVSGGSSLLGNTFRSGFALPNRSFSHDSINSHAVSTLNTSKHPLEKIDLAFVSAEPMPYVLESSSNESLSHESRSAVYEPMSFIARNNFSHRTPYASPAYAHYAPEISYHPRAAFGYTEGCSDAKISCANLPISAPSPRSYIPEQSYGSLSCPPRLINEVICDSKRSAFEPVCFESKKSSADFFNTNQNNPKDFGDRYGAPSDGSAFEISGTNGDLNGCPVEARQMYYCGGASHEERSLQQADFYSEDMPFQPKSHSAGLNLIAPFQHPSKPKTGAIDIEKPLEFFYSSFLTPPLRNSDDLVLTSSFSATPSTAHPSSLGFL